MQSPKYAALFIILATTVFILGGCEMDSIFPPKAETVTGGDPDIGPTRLEPYNGPKARLAVSRFEVNLGTEKLYGNIVGDGLAYMLADSLFQTNRFVMLERRKLEASGPVGKKTPARIEEIEGAELLVRGSIIAFEPGTAGTKGNVENLFGGFFGDLFQKFKGSTQTSHVAINLRVIDATTFRIVASTIVEGTATNIDAETSGLGFGLSGFSKTPMEKALRIAVQEAVAFVVKQTPQSYYRHGEI